MVQILKRRAATILRRSATLRRINALRKIWLQVEGRRWALARAELLPGPSAAQPWRLKTGEVIYLRPKTTDLQGAVEVFAQRLYVLPERTLAVLRDVPVVVDAGANIGLFSLSICQQCPDVKVIAYEPDPANAAVARMTLATHIAAGRVELHEAAVGTSEGTLRFTADLGMNSHEALPDEPAAIEVKQVDLLKQTPGTGLLKLDAEGAEWKILRDRRWNRQAPRSVAMEWHRLHAEGREPEPDTAILALLTGAGFEVEPEPFVGAGAMTGNVWAWRSSPE